MYLRILFTIGLMFASSGVALPGTFYTKGPVTIEMISDKISLEPGKDLQVGFKLRAPGNWHFYWKNPGDAGAAPVVEWKLPPGITAGELFYPNPKRIAEGPLVTYGYNEDLLLKSTLKIASSHKPLQTIGSYVNAKLTWTVCREVCLQDSIELSLLMPVRSTKAEASENAHIFDYYKDRYPLNQPGSWQIKLSDKPDSMVLSIDGVDIGNAAFAKDTYFMPAVKNQIENAATQKVTWDNSILNLELKKSKKLTKDPGFLVGILHLGDKTYVLDSSVQAASESLTSFDPVFFIQVLFLAFLAGLILNLMPCVFPILAIKAVNLVEQARSKTHRAIKIHSLIYTLGILVSFWILALIIESFRASGLHLGWGFQLQTPGFVAILAIVFFLMMLNLLGLFEINSSLFGLGHKLAIRKSYAGSFFTGFLATLVSTPCTAPFMGTAIAFALTQNTLVCLSVFTALGLGLAAPYVLLSFMPKLARVLPKSGMWMVHFKRALAIPIFATILWLVWVLNNETNIVVVGKLFGSFFFLGLTIWLLKGRQTLQSKALAVVFVILALGLPLHGVRNFKESLAHADLLKPASGDNVDTKVETNSWQGFSPEKLASLLQDGKAVLINFTADWCITCKVNEMVAFTPTVLEALKAKNIVLLKADLTNPNEILSKTLANYGREGVPLYVFYAANDKGRYTLLPQMLTPQIVLGAVEKVTAP